MRAVVIAVLFALPSGLAVAAQMPQPGATDPRIQSVDYDPDQVVILEGSMGRETMLEFGPGEQLENVAIGNSLGWQVTPNKRADLLFIKPLDKSSVTNMTVVTNERRYAFELRVAKGAGGVITPYVVKFNYQAPAIAIPVEPPPEQPPEVVNSDYTMSGDAANRPLTIFDDGRMVYFKWPADAAVPAIFAVSSDNSESLVNYVVKGDYIVVEQLAPRFALRNGKQVVTVTDGAYKTELARGGPR